MPKRDGRDEWIEERARDVGVPVIPRLPTRVGPNPVVAICGECGRDIRRLEGYVCGVSNCPLRITVSC